jgi:hypothetical protein
MIVNYPVIQNFLLNFSELSIKKADIEILIGYAPGESPEPICSLIDEVLVEAQFCTNISGGFAIQPLHELLPEKHGLMINKQVFEVQKVVYNRLKKASEIAIFVCTAGSGLGDWSKQLMKDGDLLKGYIVDTAGTVIVEAAMDKIQLELQNSMLAQDKRITNRYSPGYCGWDVNEQHKLFSFFTQGFCGVTLTESALMHPVKSVSGFIGIGQEVRYNQYTCKVCDNKNCIYKSRSKQA